MYLARTMQNILVLIVEAKHAGAILQQHFEDVKMAISRSKVERSAFLNAIWLVSGFGQGRSHLYICSINTSTGPFIWFPNRNQTLTIQQEVHHCKVSSHGQVMEGGQP